MKYKTLLPSPRGCSRLTNTIGVTSKHLVFNKTIQETMRIPRDECFIGILVNEDRFICLTVLKDNSANTAFRLTAPKSAKSRTRLCSPGFKVISHLKTGRYRITGTDGAIFVTDIKYSEAPVNFKKYESQDKE